jgi:thymidylate synthase (FAD)
MNINITKSNVTYIDHMGSDKTVVNAARVSFDQVSQDNEKDVKLISYLAKHNHWSPFAHTSIQLKIKAPIFIARQLVKHQVGGVWNEVSRRYVDFEPEFFIPEKIRGRPVNAKQGSNGEIDSKYINDICDVYEFSLEKYNHLISSGVAPEQARMVLPLGTMTDWYWTGSLIFWHRVYKQRADSHAQEEATDIAKEISNIVRPLFPLSWDALIYL